MSELKVEIPDSLYERVRKMADEEGLSVDQFISNAVAATISVLDTSDYLAKRVAKGDRDRFQAALKNFPDTPAREEDRI